MRNRLIAAIALGCAAIAVLVGLLVAVNLSYEALGYVDQTRFDAPVSDITEIRNVHIYIDEE